MEKLIGEKTLAQCEIEFELYRQDDVFGLCTGKSYWDDLGAFIAHGLKLIDHYQNSREI